MPEAPTARILNCIPSRETENDWRYQNAVDAALLAEAPTYLFMDALALGGQT